jgi:protein gp37
MIFVNSMSDLFHEDIPEEYIEEVFEVMGRADHHTFQILTKRHERLAELASSLPWHPNVWIGVSVENRRFMHRVVVIGALAVQIALDGHDVALAPTSDIDSLNSADGRSR